MFGSSPAFLARQEQPPGDLEELTAELVRSWRNGLPVTKGGHNAFVTVAGILRDDERVQAGPVADELALRRKRPLSKVQSYTEAELAQVTTVARRRFRAALQRINGNALHLQRWREGAFPGDSRDWVIGEGLDILARTGSLPRYTSEGSRTTIEIRYRRAFGRGGMTWQRLFLTRDEAVALGVLLMAEFGWNLSVINRAEVPQASPDLGEDGHPTYRIELVKPRRGAGRHYETRNVTDYGADSPGRLITQALQATRFARAILEQQAPGTRRLIVWRAWRPSRRAAASSAPALTTTPRETGQRQKGSKESVPPGPPHGDRARPPAAGPAFPGYPRPSLRTDRQARPGRGG